MQDFAAYDRRGFFDGFYILRSRAYKEIVPSSKRILKLIVEISCDFCNSI